MSEETPRRAFGAFAQDGSGKIHVRWGLFPDIGRGAFWHLVREPRQEDIVVRIVCGAYIGRPHEPVTDSPDLGRGRVCRSCMRLVSELHSRFILPSPDPKESV